MMTILRKSAAMQEQFRLTMLELNEYKVFTSFYSDFTIADFFGENAILDTYRRAFKSWKYDYKYITELSIVLNHKIFEHYDRNSKLAKIYDKLWRELDDYCCENLKGEESEYYFEITD